MAPGWWLGSFCFFMPLMFGRDGQVCLSPMRRVGFIVGIGLVGLHGVVGIVAQCSLVFLTARLVDLVLFWNVSAGTAPQCFLIWTSRNAIVSRAACAFSLLCVKRMPCA